ncbi:MAG: hypothetical protein EGP07_00110 [SAR202 cluster bacterium]|nr:MAG: hypothetical protein EGP07_00110 [SAR202 cluster bacterium]
MPIGLYRELETPQPRDFIEAVNSLNDNLGKKNVQILHSIAKPNQVLIFAGYKSLAECESQSDEYVSAGLPQIVRDHGVSLVDQGFSVIEASNDPEHTMLGTHDYVVLTGGLVKIGKMAEVIASGSRVIEKIGPELLSQGIASMLIRAVSGNNLNMVANRVALPSIEATEEFITRSPGGRPEIAEDMKEWLGNMKSITRGVYKVKRKFGPFD